MNAPPSTGSSRRMKRWRMSLVMGFLCILLALAAWIAVDVTRTPWGMSADGWILLIGPSIAFGATTGWFCRRIILLMLFSLALGYLIPSCIYYAPVAMGRGHFRSYESWAPAYIPQFILYSAPAVLIAASIACSCRAKHDLKNGKEFCP